MLTEKINEVFSRGKLKNKEAKFAEKNESFKTKLVIFKLIALIANFRSMSVDDDRFNVLFDKICEMIRTSKIGFTIRFTMTMFNIAKIQAIFTPSSVIKQ